MGGYAILLAAGASTRMRSEKSKLLYPVCGRTLIEWGIRQAASIADHLVVVVGHQKEEVSEGTKAAAKSLSKKIKSLEFAHQQKPLGTADAVKAALQKLKNAKASEPVFIMGADSVFMDPESLKRLSDFHSERNAVLTVVTSFLNPPHSYGRIVRNSAGVIDRIVEVKGASPEILRIPEINTGFYMVQAGALEELVQNISNTGNIAKEFYLTDMVEAARSRGWLVETFSLKPSEAHGINTQEDYAEGLEILRSRIARKWMLTGVTLLDPKTIWIDDQVVLEPGVVIEAGVHLRGESSVKAGTRIGAYSLVIDSSIGANCQIEAYSHLQEARLKDRVRVGPFARLRPEAELDEDVRIGNFVEVKKSKMRKGSKANHLSYVGDADVGEAANIGAGTITCNYDGYKKSKTNIGAGVFIGSNSALVAPIKIESGAFVAAGSTITTNIPKDSLGVARSRQSNIKNWATGFRKKNKNK